jgi:glutamate/tyrosine decarboxylase-like PLP-dependent enzyme
LELVTAPEFGSVVFRFRPGAAGADRVNARIPDLLLARGRAVVGHTVVRGKPALKLTFCNPATEDRHVTELLDTIVECGEEIGEDPCGILPVTSS